MVSTGSSNSFTSKNFYSQSYSNQSKLCESSQNDLGNNLISLPVKTANLINFPVNKVMVLPSSSVSKIIPILTSPDNQLVPNKAKNKEQEHNDIKTDNQLSSSKGKEREHIDITNSNFRTIVSSTGLKSVQDDDEIGDMEVDDNIPQP